MMGMSHTECSHDRTPAGRAACRKQQAEWRAAINGESLHDEGILDAGQPDAARKTRKRSTLTDPTNRPRKSASGALKRPGTFLRTIGDLADVPHRLAYVVREAWTRDGWNVRVGHEYNENERRIEILAPYGVISLVWRTSTPDGIWGVFWRNTGNSITRRIDNVNQAMRLGAGEETL